MRWASQNAPDSGLVRPDFRHRSRDLIRSSEDAASLQPRHRRRSAAGASLARRSDGPFARATRAPLLLKRSGAATHGSATARSRRSRSIDYGSTRQRAEVAPPPNRLAWQRWRATVRLPQDVYDELWARAADDRGRSQPMVVPGWNPKGYLNNACHRIAVLAQC